MAKLRIMSQRDGDTVVEYDVKDEAAVADAKQRFAAALAEGFRAYAVETVGGKREGIPVKEFDPTAKELLLVAPLQGGQ